VRWHRSCLMSKLQGPTEFVKGTQLPCLMGHSVGMAFQIRRYRGTKSSPGISMLPDRLGTNLLNSWVGPTVRFAVMCDSSVQISALLEKRTAMVAVSSHFGLLEIARYTPCERWQTAPLVDHLAVNGNLGERSCWTVPNTGLGMSRIVAPSRPSSS